jgi:metallophosphoesterase superfamily enzyme
MFHYIFWMPLLLSTCAFLNGSDKREQFVTVGNKRELFVTVGNKREQFVTVGNKREQFVTTERESRDMVYVDGHPQGSPKTGQASH